jgi:hypothetical protein
MAIPLPCSHEVLSARPAARPATALDWAELTVVSARIDWLHARRGADDQRLGRYEHTELRKEIDDAVAERERIVERLFKNLSLAVGDD